ncbi:inositol monophosphatase family protein [Roseisalinus antarcticus]|uniref:Inositol-1-monophosphatase n=1 Tax=Roseisalinus antarcticus TaxID=254357 RepID=A0A1Y5S0J7_9RHOB|nr:inositol monophosphatase family protein [Roseisalinus antarcticus]SLN28459.1 Inositol-1-monophosphatase [Roseisalinus antarcticus]
MAFSANLNVMIKTVRRAARGLVKDFGEVENLQVSAKGPGDFVSRADREAERMIREALTEARPTYGFLGEESGEVPGEDPTRRWIVDPLDGTTNFLHGMPHWAISVALEHKGQIVAGVIYDPSKDELFHAEKGEGAWMNQSRMRVSGRTRITECVFATGLPSAGRGDLPQRLRDLGRVLPTSAGVRSLGAPSLDLAYLAAGRCDGFWDRGAKPWQLAAGMVLVREAGGFVEPLDPAGDILADGGILCANEPVFSEFAALIRRD